MHKTAGFSSKLHITKRKIGHSFRRLGNPPSEGPELVIITHPCPETTEQLPPLKFLFSFGKRTDQPLGAVTATGLPSSILYAWDSHADHRSFVESEAYFRIFSPHHMIDRNDNGVNISRLQMARQLRPTA